MQVSNSFKAIKYLETRNNFLSTIESEISGTDLTPSTGSLTSSLACNSGEAPVKDVQLLTLEQMMNAGMHLGHSKATLAPNFRQYSLGVRHGIVIIDLDKTLAALRRAAQVAYEIAKLGGIILLVGTRPTYVHLVEQIARSLNIFFISGEWTNGLLTNAKRTLKEATSSDAVLFTPPGPSEELGPLAQRSIMESGSFSQLPSGMFKEQQLHRNSSYNNYVSTPSQVSLPDLVIVVDGPTNVKAFEECNAVLIPTIGIIDSNFDASLCTYPIPANDDSIASVDFVLSSLASAIKNGRDCTFPSPKSQERPADVYIPLK
ncbi:30S ribosomal protein S2-like protein [Mitosporidium daphniae]|uniref:30S ribosomal protein S2-like protein n=1 Tax=Mitosporidium daphniae TaxID=1485682 RepID=A0A098VRC8_9MICR|nr:30S ribosomal protein S2-like protein [Mitosporidium daphniae]KGG51587.1 30S ribosomal protein S2-like protein [Mitosporidium daphniae]|eukprot:XP_013238045.1 30S ribosomal protein S2-like protein [Mitosporidium daphniae]